MILFSLYSYIMSSARQPSIINAYLQPALLLLSTLRWTLNDGHCVLQGTLILKS